MAPSFTRRALMALAGGAAALAALPARALTTSEAERFLQGVANELESILQSATEQNKQTDRVLALLHRSVAFDDIARFTMGANWRRMSPEQQQRFLGAFENFLARLYANNFAAYRGQSFDITGVQDAGNRGVVVRSIIRDPQREDVRVDWLVSDRSGQPQIIDVIAEGVSISITQREEFASRVERFGGDIDRFISDLESRG